MPRRLAVVAAALALGVGCRARDSSLDGPAAAPQVGDAGSGGDVASGLPGTSGSPGTGAGDAAAADAQAFLFAEQAASARPLTGGGPMSLTASDGTGLQLVSLVVRGVVESPLAFTELHLTFRNPEPRTREGRFRVTLPDGAAVSRFAMRVGDRWQEGEVVEREKARQTYEDFLHRRQDPALLEQQAGSEFTARVFPIPAGADKELVISYSEELAGADEPYRIRLRGLPTLARLDIRVLLGRQGADDGAPTARAAGGAGAGATAGATETVEVARQGWEPDQDFEVAAPSVPGRLGLRHDNLVLARVVPVVDRRPSPVRSMLFLVDTSASRALGFAEQIRRVRRLVEGLVAGAGPATPIVVAAFDQEMDVVHEGRAGAFGRAHADQLRQRGALGASDMGAALRWAAEYLRAHPGAYHRVLLVTDGVATAGRTGGDALRKAVAELGKHGVTRLDALVVGGLRDEGGLRRLVTAGLPEAGIVVDGDRPLAEIGRRLGEATRSGSKVSVAGARWVWPRRLDGLQSGDEVTIYADLPAHKPFRLSLGGVPMRPDGHRLDRIPRPLLERAWVKARIDRLTHKRDTVAAGDADMRAALARQIVALSVRHRVLCPLTALLVLETELDYRRYGIDRSALADVLTVGDAGVTVLPRAAESLHGATERAQVQPAAERPPSMEGEEEAATATGGPARRKAREGEAEGAAQPRPSGPVAPTTPAEPPAFAADVLSPPPRRPPPLPPPPARDEERPAVRLPPYTGAFKEVKDLLAARRQDEALASAESWRAEAPADVMALLALGEACEARGDRRCAARSYGSLIDLFPSRADLRRHAGQRLDRLGTASARALAEDTYRKAVAQRPDHPSGHRLHAWSLARLGRYREAIRVLEAALRRSYPRGRYAGAKEVLREDLALVGAAWAKAEPAHAAEVQDLLAAAGAQPEDGPSLRFVLSWETDANDVDFHIEDGRGGQAWYEQPVLPSGGRLYADVTTGYGPECFALRAGIPDRAYPYHLQAHYYRQGPMGFGMGSVQVIDHDGRGDVVLEDRPFVVMQDGAFIDLGEVAGPLVAGGSPSKPRQ